LKAGVSNVDQEDRCSVCGELRERYIDFPLYDGSGLTERRKVGCMCRCERERQDAYEKRMKFEEEQRRIDELRQLSLMDARLRNVNMASFWVTDENRRYYTIAKRYIDNFQKLYEKGQGLLFWGDVGTGKSFTAAAIANELLNRKCSVIMTSFVKLLGEIGISANNEYIDRLNQAKLLVVDDLGAERGTDYALEKVYDIIDSRYRCKKPIILTTNLSLQHMKTCEDMRYSRIYDRVFEMCYPVKFDGMSWRKKEAMERLGDIKKLLEE